MASAVEADLRQLKLAMGLYERYDRAVTTAEIHAEIAERLREELDYEREAAHMRLYGAILGGEPGVAVPRPVPELSTRRLLTMTWLDGAPILETAKAPTARRNEVALRMFRVWYVPFYHYGVIHGDPHLGNYTVAPDGTVNLLDFGCVRVFRASFVRGVIDLYHALERGDRDLAVSAYQRWGFGDLSTRDDRRAEPLGALCLRAVARRPRAADPGEWERRRWRAPSSKACTATSAGWAGSSRRANSSLWTAPRSGSARCSCT